MNRRALIKGVGAGLAGAALGLWPKVARAAWGDPEPGVWGGAPAPARSILEIYLWGGMAPWESFYYRPAAGSTTRGFDADVSALLWNSTCPGTPSGLASQFLGNDAAGNAVHLGPFARPLWRADIASRLRVVVMQHDLSPHEAAIPYALSGQRLGRPGSCGLGAPLQRRGRALDTSNGHPLPFSYCLSPDPAIGSPLFEMLDATGSHGGNAKPVVIPIGSTTAAFVANLTRSVTGVDPLLSQYRAQYASRLVPSGSSLGARSAAFRDYDSSVSSLFAAPSLASLLGGLPLTAGAAQFCSSNPPPNFSTGSHFAGTALRAAALLLNDPVASQRANYVCVVDGGLNNSGFAYDVHTFSAAQRTSSNLWETLAALADVIRLPADPPDPGKIDLDQTLVVIRTEFGRTPFRSLGGVPSVSSSGRDHWPDGYTSVLIGGPIHTAGVVGAISDGTGNGGQGVAEPGRNYKPLDIQAAALLGAGIDPFADGNLPVGDLTPSLSASTHLQAALNLRQTLLGVP